MHTAGKIKENILNAVVLVALLFVFGTVAYANVTARPTAVNFGNQTVDTASAPVGVILTNTGRGGIEIVNASVATTQFSYSGPSLPVTLYRGQSLTAYVTFQPSAAQAYNGTLIFKRSNGSTISVSLSGVGIQTQATLLPPTITTQPASQTVTSGQAATFMVGVTGTAPLAYQWKKNGTAISGATSSTYTTPATTTSDNAAQFTAVVTNSAGSATSTAAILTVNAPVSASYKLVTSPTALSFSWQSGSAAPVAQSIKIMDNSPNCEPITITTDHSWLTVSPGSGCTAPLMVSVSINTAGLAAGSYSGNVIITGPTESNSGFTVPVTLSVTGGTVAPSITTQPASQTVIAGQTATFTVAATGTAPMTYQWKKNGTAISGATSSTYTTPATTTSDNTAQFIVVVTNSAGSTISAPATLTINAATAILNASSTSLSFGSITVSSSIAQNVTLTNTGNSNVTVSNVSVSGAGFTASGVPTGLILTPKQTATLSATFTPAATGSVTGSVTVTSNASNSPDAIALSGTGVAQVNHSVSLSWTTSTSVVTGYNSYSGTKSGGPYAKLTTTPVAATTYTDTTVQAGQTYYYVVTSVDSSGVESAYSNETSATIP